MLQPMDTSASSPGSASSLPRSSVVLTFGCKREQKSFLSQQNLVMIEDLRQQYFSFLVDAGFIQISEGDKRDLLHTRHGKSRTRFVRVPAELDTYSRDPKAVMACLAGSMYPKLLVVDPQSGQMRTLSNNAPAAIHPSSVNFAVGRRIEFGNAKFIVFFTAMHTKKLCEYRFFSAQLHTNCPPLFRCLGVRER